jgi:rfaE bifunctional protein kinase chain/domain
LTACKTEICPEEILLINLSEKRLDKIIASTRKKKVLVFGDLMVDEYLWGHVSRISPEAPVPIINISNAQVRFGGAANVAFNLVGLEQTPILVGLIGNDRMGEQFHEMLTENKLPVDGILSVNDRPTTVKTRIIGNNQHIARVDRESVDPITPEIQEKLFENILNKIEDISAIIIQDYNKGVVEPRLVKHIIELADRHGKIVAVDPKFEHFFAYKNATLFKPNTKEVEEALAIRIRNEEDLRMAGKELLTQLNSEAVLITRGAHGMALFEKNGDHAFVETKARKVADVSGAGDTVIATLTYALTGGANMKEAVTLSNFAAGLVCEEVGVVPVYLEKLREAVIKDQRK